MTIIDALDLCKTFRTRVSAPGVLAGLRGLVKPEWREVEAVKNVSFVIDAGERVAFIGPNGAGKSTMIKMLVGILHPTSGQARVIGRIPWTQREDLSREIGAVFGQKSQLWYHLPPQDSFDLVARLYGVPRADYARRLQRLVALFEIEEYLTTPVRKLSLGERMRCEIVASLLHGPTILFLDEPTIGLDVTVKQRIRDLILALNQQDGVTIFLTSHDAGDVEVLCKRTMVINHGEVIFDGRVSELRRNFIQTRTISLKLGENWRGFDHRGVSVVKQKGYGVKLTVDTSVASIDRVVGQLLSRYAIRDIAVLNPPMEEIISSIYERGPKRTRGSGGGESAEASGSGGGDRS